MISASVLYNQTDHPNENASGSGVIPTGSIYYNTVDCDAYVYNGDEYKSILGTIKKDGVETKIDLNDSNVVSGSEICSATFNRLRMGETINFEVLGGILNNTGTSRNYTYVLKLKDDNGELLTRISDSNSVSSHTANRSHLDLKWVISVGNAVTYVSGMVERASSSPPNTGSSIASHFHVYNFDTYMYTSSFTASVHIATSATGTVQNLSRRYYSIVRD